MAIDFLSGKPFKAVGKFLRNAINKGTFPFDQLFPIELRLIPIDVMDGCKLYLMQYLCCGDENFLGHTSP